MQPSQPGGPDAPHRDSAVFSARARRPARRIGAFVFTVLLIEFLDELVFGAREAAWPLIRDDLALSYAQVGLLLGLPTLIANFIEPIIGILGDIWKRRALVLGGGAAYMLGLLLVRVSAGLWA